MGHTVVSTDKAPTAIGPYSQGIAAGHMVFVSGQLGMDPKTTELVGQDLESQARQALANLKQIVIASGCELTDIVAVDVFLTDMNDFVAFNAIYSEYFSEHKPARAAIGVASLPKGARVEVKCIAVKS
ncbi:RidA/YER057c/UK114 superfamily protein [Olavius algarvensis associated proteobacterium Delta 3]|nr:RidA/YER057c/UK114 superfamily protein [Olavius algarvensis associated proteobacterium Delta 3]